MTISSRVKIMILVALVLLSTGIISVTFNNFRTAPTPPEVRAGWYLPQKDIVWPATGQGTNQSPGGQLILTGWRDGPAPGFPDISPYCRHENYSRQDTGRKYVIAVWYFSDDRRFQKSQKTLHEFLIHSGTITEPGLDFSGIPEPGDHSGNTSRNDEGNDWLPSRLTTTGYEGPNTSGLFFTVAIPAPADPSGKQIPDGDTEHYIVYYGTAEPALLAPETDFLREMIRNTYTYGKGSSAGPIEER
ncbi:MAG: hypothetical protein LUQ66_12920 [Methanoregula sp.]|nr:hypothetical protein [Methanoregula sp.]